MARTVLVTGSTSGYGLATARQFHAQGDRVILTGRRADRLAALQDELGERCTTLCFDVRVAAQIQGALDALPEGWRDIDVLVNNAGLALGLGGAWQVDVEDWDVMIDTNCRGLVTMTRAVLPGMVARGSGHVVNISSISGSWPYPGGNVYGATKAFVTQFSHNLRCDLVGHAIRVTNIEPGASETEFSLVRFKGDARAAGAVYEGFEPLRAEDIAGAVCWAVNSPAHVNVSRIELFPTMQAGAGLKTVRAN
ncbi:MAG: SDR family NAD(P)-dependent oxidoreductase [Myxococcota bacterium]